MTNRDIVDSIDDLIKLRIQNAMSNAPSMTANQNEDRIEQLKREITDALVDRDQRKGVIAGGISDTQLNQL